MSTRQTAIPCAILRGGTSRGVYFHNKDLPENASERDRILPLSECRRAAGPCGAIELPEQGYPGAGQDLRKGTDQDDKVLIDLRKISSTMV